MGAFFLEGLAGFTGASSSESAKRSSSSEPAFFSGSCLGRENTLEGAIKDFRDFEAILFVEKDLGIYKPFHLGKIYFLVHF